MLSRTSKPLGIKTTFIDFEGADEQVIRQAIRPDTKVRTFIAECSLPQGDLAGVPYQPYALSATHTPHRVCCRVFAGPSSGGD
jgi:hypothetical protein